ncbi:DUF1972 domain-containing protein [Sphingobacteriales bacterium UPWRP_1]|nr:glycosyl transferase [Sphingobacteriales bacterium TSM_CSM]PSJ74382.1 DUF1972 domain-containing protein [Sphingobacteriales bacterium UPWRP_1]
MQKTAINLAIIGTVGVPARYGGFETLAENLVKELGEQMNISVYCSAKVYPEADRPKVYHHARLFYLPFKANGLQSIIYDAVSILHALVYADVLLILGVSAGFMVPLLRWFTRKKIIVSIDGIEWKRNKWSKWVKLYLWICEYLAVKFAHADITDNEAIQNYTAIRYKTLSTVIEYGANHVMQVKPAAADRVKYPFLVKPYAFKVCRIEPENNIHLILEAFSKMPQHTLVLVGNWQNSPYGRQLRFEYSRFANLVLLDPIYQQHELDLLRSNCLVYIHGHSAGGTNPSLVEAMYLGLPVIAYGVSYNYATTEGKALYFTSARELCTIIAQTPVVRYKQVAAIMQAVAGRRYRWPVIALKYKKLIETVLTAPQRQPVHPKISHYLPYKQLQELGLAHLQTPSGFYEYR